MTSEDSCTFTPADGLEPPAGLDYIAAVSEHLECLERADEQGCCPACGGSILTIKCKVVCSRCKALISNCNGD